MDTGSVFARKRPLNLARMAITAIGTAICLGLLSLTFWAYWTFKDQPLQPSHSTVATVVSIAPTFGRSNRQMIVVRNANGIGYVSTLIGATHCDVGDKVPVIQRGKTLLATPKTCK